MEPKNNSSKIIGIIVIVLIILAGIWLMTKKQGTSKVETASVQTSQTAETASVQDQGDPAVNGIKSNGTSDAELDANAAAIDAELAGYASDNATAQSSAQ